MKKKIIIVSASVVVLAFIVALGISAQGRKNSKNITTEQTDKKVSENVKAVQVPQPVQKEQVKQQKLLALVNPNVGKRNHAENQQIARRKNLVMMPQNAVKRKKLKRNALNQLSVRKNAKKNKAK